MSTFESTPAGSAGVATTPPDSLEAVTGVQLARGLGHRPSKGFWADAWDQVVRSWLAVAGLSWVSAVAFFACFAPFIANGHPYVLHEVSPSGDVTRTTYPLFEYLSAADILLGVGGVVAIVWLFAPIPIPRSRRVLALIVAGVQGIIITVATRLVSSWVSDPNASDFVRNMEQQAWFRPVAVSVLALLVSAPIPFLRFLPRASWRIGIVAAVGIAAILANIHGFSRRPAVYNYFARQERGEIRALFAPIPFSPTQRDTQLDLVEPGFTLAQALEGIKDQRDLADRPDDPVNDVRSPTFILGTDAFGQDVLSQLLHACRLSISIGLVSTGIAVVIGVTLGALMGYFGGWVDMALFRVVEIFMAVPVLFLLIVAAGVLPDELRTTYVVMAIIGCFTWTNAARFIRSEFMKLRGQDFVQSAQAVGLPLPSILFKHMLPNGVTPVLVDASFAVAVAILFESILSFLGLGPVDQASWGRLLSQAQSQIGTFVPHLAVAPGGAIFLTVLSFTLVGEALRDAIDPKLKKARV